jgi:tetratricopeptide (TPR) repeat protein
MTEEQPSETYTRKQVRRVLGISEVQLKRWEKQELVPALDSFGMPDLIALRALKELRKNHVSAARIQRVLEEVRKKLDGITNPLRELKIFCEGRTVAILIDGQKMEAISGQLLLNFDRAELAKMLSFPNQSPAEERRRMTAAQQREAESWFQNGLELEQTGAPATEIIEAYEHAIALDPHSAGALVNLGTIHYHLRHWKQAEQYYQSAIEADPDYSLAHFNLGNLYDEQGNRDLAVKHYKSAIQLSASYADPHYNLALLYQSTGDAMSAVRHWKIYLKLDGSSSWAAIARRELEKLRQAAVVQGSSNVVRRTGLESVS